MVDWPTLQRDRSVFAGFYWEKDRKIKRGEVKTKSAGQSFKKKEAVLEILFVAVKNFPYVEN